MLLLSFMSAVIIVLAALALVVAVTWVIVEVLPWWAALPLCLITWLLLAGLFHAACEAVNEELKEDNTARRNNNKET